MSGTAAQSTRRETTHAEESHARAKHSSQINTRISTSLKEQGEAGFAAAGLTSSEAIRMLYEFAAAHVLQPESIKQALSHDSNSPNDLDLRQKRLAALRQGPQIVSGFLENANMGGIDAEIASLPYKRLEELAYAEKHGIEV